MIGRVQGVEFLLREQVRSHLIVDSSSTHELYTRIDVLDHNRKWNRKNTRPRA
jgi:hypothetical protein